MKHLFSFRPLSSILRDRRGNVLMIMGFSLLPLIFTAGMVIDYSRAARMQTKLNALTDAASLSATTSPMLEKPWQAACNAARDTFRNQLQDMKGVTFNNANLRIVVVETYASKADATRTCSTSNVTVPSGEILPVSRNVTVSYDADSQNIFGGILKKNNIAIGGTSTVEAEIAPKIDFYMLLDVSSSMALPVTSAGISFMRSKTVTTTDPNGCAFACHETAPNNKNIKDKYGTTIDYYSFAKLNNIELRVDAGKLAMQSTIDRGYDISVRNKTVYRFSSSVFDTNSGFKNIGPLTDNRTTAKTQASTAAMRPVTKGVGNWDRQSEHHNALAKAMEIMPNPPGNGTNQAGDTPQAVLFMITDGMRDEELWGRQLGGIPTSNCDAIKARGIRIGIIYTTYQPDSINYDSWSKTNILWRLPDIRPTLEKCASPRLFVEVSTDGDISAALNKLFDQTVAATHITN